MQKVKVIGAGLAGAEAAYYLANKGVNILRVHDVKEAVEIVKLLQEFH